MVGPTGNFSQFSDFSKLVLTFDMLGGAAGAVPAPDCIRKEYMVKIIENKE